jgi:hypothetical protein
MNLVLGGATGLSQKFFGFAQWALAAAKKQSGHFWAKNRKKSGLTGPNRERSAAQRSRLGR